MRLNWFMAAMLGVSLLGVAQQQQPKVLNAQFHTQPVGSDCPRRWADFSIQVDHSGWAMRSSCSRNAFPYVSKRN